MFTTQFYNDRDMECFYLSLGRLMTNFGCSYLGYVVEDTCAGARIAFTSDPDWQDEYVGNHLIDHCHLWRACINNFEYTNRRYFILPWDTVKPYDSVSKDIYLYRKERNIGNKGVSFCQRTPRYREFLAISPGDDDGMFIHSITSNINFIRNELLTFRNRTYKYLKKY